MRLWKNLHPSEDGEALQRNLDGDLRTRSGSKPECVHPVHLATRWFAVYTTCRHEKKIARHFDEREIEYYLPLYRSARKWRDGSRVTLDLPLFPCYIFVHINRGDRSRILNVPGALAIVGGTGGEPASVPDDAIAALRVGLETQRIEPHPLLTVGHRARIRSGAFAGMDGIVVRKKGGFRVVLTLEQIMQSIAIEVDEVDLEPLVHAGFSPARTVAQCSEFDMQASA